MASTILPSIMLCKNGDEYILSTHTPVKTVAFAFKPGVEFEHEALDGRNVTAVVHVEANTLREVQTDTDGRVVDIERIFTEDEMRMEIRTGDVTARRVFK
ncbi:probable fatty acid-binding protein isoform X2 [Cylas formicarius]|nr:probable fatty acid-binding protein isoform X2 [Cylas formicarius]